MQKNTNQTSKQRTWNITRNHSLSQNEKTIKCSRNSTIGPGDVHHEFLKQFPKESLKLLLKI